jgi:hypothetical protein
MRALALCLLLLGCEPTCEQQGGTLVQKGDYYVWQWIDMRRGIGYLQPYPNYVCILKDEK